MVIYDLNHLEVVSEASSIVGGDTTTQVVPFSALGNIIPGLSNIISGLKIQELSPDVLGTLTTSKGDGGTSYAFTNLPS
jgi:hypothetical protein